MRTRIAYSILIAQLLCCGILCAQKTTIINHFPADTTGHGNEGYLPARSTEHQIIINYYEPASKVALDNFQNLASAYLNLYIDHCAHIVQDKLRLKKSKKQTLQDLNSIVTGILEFYPYENLKDFKSFSKVVSKKLDAINSTDFRNISIHLDSNNEDEIKYLKNQYLTKELNALKQLVGLEVGLFTNYNLLVKTSSDSTVIDDDVKDQILNNYTDYDSNQPLKPIKVKLSDESVALITFRDRTNINGKSSSTPIVYSDSIEGSMAERMMALLEHNHDAIATMQSQINELRTEQMLLWQAQQDVKTAEINQQIAELRTMILALMSDKHDLVASTFETPSSQPENPKTSGTITNLPQAINIYFETSASTLNASSQMALNEIVDILARDPSIRLIITGYADKKGDATKNLILSQKRAQSVKNFLSSSGLSENRFVTKYFGDRDSRQESKNDRKVVIAFVR